MMDWSKLKVVDLRAELKKRGLPHNGLKPALVARLAAAETETGSESENTVQDDANKPSPSVTTSPDTISQPHPPDADSVTEDPGIEPTPQTNAPVLFPQDAPVEQEPTSQVVATTESSQSLGRGDGYRSAELSIGPTHSEISEDRQKRKRRSQSPTPSSAEFTRKRLRQDEMSGSNKEITSTEVTSELGDHNVIDFATTAAQSGNSNHSDSKNGVVREEAATKETYRTEAEEEREKVVQTENMDVDIESKPLAENVFGDSPSRIRGSRFKDLFSAPKAQQQGLENEGSNSRDEDMTIIAESEPDRVISPAIHPATSSLYIRDFMRPLNPGHLKTHLASLATPPGHEPHEHVITNFYLDPIRTHAFISFTNVSAASRVRSAIHNRIWPDERNRKSLWADFIPPEKVNDWVAEEETPNPGGRISQKKWEIYYHTDEDRQVSASLQEVGTLPPVRRLSTQQPPPTGPRAPAGPRIPPSSENRHVESPTRINPNFKSTTAQPTIYWLPVSKDVANRRLDQIDAVTSKEPSRRLGGDDLYRYSFEDEMVLVDRGPEIFPGIRPPRGYRAPIPGVRAGGVGHPGRGGYGGGYGGDRGGYRGDRGYDRRYDSYRGDQRDSRDSRDSRDLRDRWY
ncbi:hypothetical protein B7494_g5334 [Chlorociboria aeruginascens]|nr:hypothetical protein B7494_g5334 [Chlorociboria aeruginascens]